MRFHLFVSFLLSIIFHLLFFTVLQTIELLQQTAPKKVKVLYIKPIKNTPVKAEVKKTLPKQTVSKTTVKTEKSLVKKPVEKRPEPTPIPSNKPEEKATEAKDSQKDAKFALLKKHPYFKNWSEERLRKLELPPGMKNWEEALKLTNYFDNEYNWTLTPPELGVEPGKSEPSPSPVPWQRVEIDPLAKKYEIRFYLEQTGFISSIEEEKDLNITWFPFSPGINEEKEIAPEENLPDEQINFFILPWKDLYRDNVELMIEEIKVQYELILEEAEKAKVSN